MLSLDEDMAAVFYSTDFATTFTRQRPLAPDADVVAIFGVADGEALDSRAMAVTRTVQMPASQDVRADDVLVVKLGAAQPGLVVGTQFRVLDMPQRMNDGMEMQALLGSV